MILGIFACRGQTDCAGAYYYRTYDYESFYQTINTDKDKYRAAHEQFNPSSTLMDLRLIFAAYNRTVSDVILAAKRAC